MSIPPSPRRRPSSALIRARTGALAAGTALCLALAPLAQAQIGAPAAPVIVQLPTLAPLVKKVMPAVVNVSVSMKAGGTDEEDTDDNDNDNDNGDQDQMGPGPQEGMPQSPFDEFLRRFFQQQQQGHGGMPAEPHAQRMALGSGFIIDPSGYVVTNNHVVQNADKVTVIFQDDSKHPAKVVGRDPKTDLALLKIDAPKPLPYVQWGDSDASSGRRLGAGGRQSVRPRRHGQLRHHLGARPRHP